MYLPDTNVLITRFLASDGVGEVSDFMPIGVYTHDHPHASSAGSTVPGVKLDLTCEPRFDYGRAAHEVELRDGEVLSSSSGPDAATIRPAAGVPVTVAGDGATITTFDLGLVEPAAFHAWSQPGCPARPRRPTTSPTSSRTP